MTTCFGKEVIIRFTVRVFRERLSKRHHHRHHKRQPGERNFAYRWSPASLTPPKNQNSRAALGRPAIKLLGAGGEGGSASLRTTNSRP